MPTLPMSSQAPDEIREQLDAGESLLWHARPRRGLVLRAWDAWRIPFSLLWCGITVRNLNMPPMIAIFFQKFANCGNQAAPSNSQKRWASSVAKTPFQACPSNRTGSP